jgi:hypothetical protein
MAVQQICVSVSGAHPSLDLGPNLTERHMRESFNRRSSATPPHKNGVLVVALRDNVPRAHCRRPRQSCGTTHPRTAFPKQTPAGGQNIVRIYIKCMAEDCASCVYRRIIHGSHWSDRDQNPASRLKDVIHVGIPGTWGRTDSEREEDGAEDWTRSRGRL